jgi:hypothetical protein
MPGRINLPTQGWNGGQHQEIPGGRADRDHPAAAWPGAPSAAAGGGTAAAQLRRALTVYQRFGLGHAAQLNFGDCFAAALAEVQAALEAGEAQLLRRRSRLTKR